MYPPLLTTLQPRLLHLILASLLVATFVSLTRLPSSSPQIYSLQPLFNHSQGPSSECTAKSEKNTKEESAETEGDQSPPQAFDLKTDGTNLSLNHEECDIKFPGLFTEIDIARSRGAVGEAPYRDGDPGFVRARIYDGRLYIVAIGDDIQHRMSALLHQIHRALIAAPVPSDIPNIEFQLSVGDYPVPNTWSLTRSDDLSEIQNTWVVPDYGFRSRLESQIDSYAEMREKIDAIDSNLSWAKKRDLAVWRGRSNRNWLRGKLIEVAAGKPWSDVAELNWNTNALDMEEFCRYKFIIYTEGITYSDTLRYFQHCRSIIITPSPRWRQYHSLFMIPTGPEQNYVKVNEDWSDLEEKVQFYLNNPIEAERVANNSVSYFRDHYLTPAGEACYWRRLFKTWRSVNDDLGTLTLEERGTNWEELVLTGKLD